MTLIIELGVDGNIVLLVCLKAVPRTIANQPVRVIFRPPHIKFIGLTTYAIQ